jgi:hypothetical protein
LIEFGVSAEKSALDREAERGHGRECRFDEMIGQRKESIREVWVGDRM